MGGHQGVTKITARILTLVQRQHNKSLALRLSIEADRSPPSLPPISHRGGALVRAHLAARAFPKSARPPALRSVGPRLAATPPGQLVATSRAPGFFEGMAPGGVGAISGRLRRAGTRSAVCVQEWAAVQRLLAPFCRHADSANACSSFRTYKSPLRGLRHRSTLAEIQRSALTA
jgi:hypothetical protein